MSSKNVNQQSQKTRDAGKQKPTYIPSRAPLKREGPMKLSLDAANSNIEVKGSSYLKEGVLIMVMAPGKIPVQITIHRPLGKTPLEQDDWVVTPTSEIVDLTRRLVDPYAGQRVALLEQKVTNYAKAQKWIFDSPEGSVFWDGQLRAQFKKYQREMDPKDFKGISEVGRKMTVERKISEYRQKLVTEMENQSVYETKSGPEGDRAQRAIPTLKGMTLERVIDRIVDHIARLPATEVEKELMVNKPKVPVKAEAPKFVAQATPNVLETSPEDIEKYVLSLRKPEDEAKKPKVKGKPQPTVKEPPAPAQAGFVDHKKAPKPKDIRALIEAVDLEYSKERDLTGFAAEMDEGKFEEALSALETQIEVPIPDHIRNFFLVLDADLQFWDGVVNDADVEDEDPDDDADEK